MFALPRLVRSRHTRTTKGSDSYGVKDQRQACDGAAWHGNVGKGDIEDEGHRERQRQKVREAAGAAGLTWDDVRSMNEPEACDLFPEQARARDAVAEVDYARVHCELQRVGVTQRLLWRERVDESGAQFLRISSATVCWVLPSDLAIVASLSPLLSPASICSLSS